MEREAAGVTAPELLEACISDVSCTRDVSFTGAAVAVQERAVAN